LPEPILRAKDVMKVVSYHEEPSVDVTDEGVIRPIQIGGNIRFRLEDILRLIGGKGCNKSVKISLPKGLSRGNQDATLLPVAYAGNTS
jgi:hypothetical protein